MEGVAVLTITAAAAKLEQRREIVSLMLARKELAGATINGRPAVLDDAAFRQAARKAKRRKAA